MRQITVQNLQDAVAGQLTGLDINEVQDLFGCFERAVSTLIQKADVPEASGRQSIFLYDGVFNYTPDPTIFGGALIDLRPQGINRDYEDTVSKTFIERFDRTKCRVPFGYLVTLEYSQGIPILRVGQAKAQQRIIIDSMSAVGNWVASGAASTLLLDTTVYYQQPAALRFNLASSGSQGILTETLTHGGDLTTYQGVGVVFLALMIPSLDLTSITLQLGSDQSNYYQVTATKGFNGSFVAQDYQLVAFDLSTATTVGSPVITNMDYVQLLFNYDGVAMNNVRMGGLWISLPSPHELLFYSAAIFKNGTSAPSVTITSTDDVILLSDPAYNLYVREAARAVALQNGGTAGSGLIAAIDLELEGNGSTKVGLYQQFRGDNPSEELRTVGNWYY